MGILQGSPVSTILFLIYISRIFDKVTKFNSEVMSLSFVDDLGFVASRYLVKRLAKALGRVAKMVLEWRKYNVVTYDITKIEAVLFSKSHCQQLNKQIVEINIKIKTKNIQFNKKATQ